MAEPAADQDLDPDAPEEAMPEGAGGSTEPPDLEEALSWSGWKLDGFSGASVGRIEGVITDASSGEPAWLLVRMGRFGHFSAVPSALAAAGIGRVWVPYDRETIREAPRVESGAPLTREQELELFAHFQIPRDQGRPADVAGRPEGSQTALPRSA